MTEKTKVQAENVLEGISASSGIVIGKAYVLDRHMICVLEHPVPEDEVANEIDRFRNAVETAQNEMRSIGDKAKSEFGDDIPFMIFDSHAQLLRDPTLISETENIIREKRSNVEWALKVLLEKYHSRFSKIKDRYFRERLSDIEQVVTRLQRHLIGEGDVSSPSLTDLAEPVVVIAHDLSPADTMQMNPEKVIGFATDVGGSTSHAGIIASSMNIPAVVGLKELSSRVRSGDSIIVDGNTGKVIHIPTNEQFVKYNKRRQQYLYYDKELQAQTDLEAKTTDGTTVRVRANIESSNDLAHLKEHGAEGVGLYRTEYLYANKSEWPDEDLQYEDYKKVAEAVSPYHAVIRTLDVGGDKMLSQGAEYFDEEPNPALGLRAIRFCLANPDIFKTQLRAILRASAHGNLKIMYPMITSQEELIEANLLLDEVREGLKDDGIPFDKSIQVGIMIETPSAVMVADQLAKHCSFFSIGTNDLIQYTMAMDRINEKVAYLYQPLSPGIIKMLKLTIEAADNAGIEISVCGKMADDPAQALLLMGMGAVRDLSMDLHSIPRIKKTIRSISLDDAKEFSQKIISLTSAKEIADMVADYMHTVITGEVSFDTEDNDS